MTILDAGEAQFAQIAQIENACFSDPWPEDTLRAHRTGEHHVFLAAVEGEETLGYISLTYVLDEGYIGNVAVSPTARRRGVGLALVEEMTSRAKALGLAFLTLEVRESNHAARALYARCGYRDVGLRRGYYEKPREDAVLMTLGLEAKKDG
ncbi:MAG: ribosomal protein S18-alanine N-acetyltransferase [Oscillospiraceae bacterium]|nr:ribosomal protein S18-alanine N-acetyltransferase [Oscillospiraceae bacterium]MBR6562220.1 ribosomal protein S18-alanine N-acetyltransferase [Oscillospiraceae bacterium]